MEPDLHRRVLEKYRLPVRNILHVSTHRRDERKAYSALGLSNHKVLWVEASHADVEQPLTHDSVLLPTRGAANDRDVAQVKFRVANNDETSASFREFKSCSRVQPNVLAKVIRQMRTVTLDALLLRDGRAEHTYNFLSLDVQGAELAVLRGFMTCIMQVDMILVQMNIPGEHKMGGAMLPELDTYLEATGFVCVEIWGSKTLVDCVNALYMRKTAVCNLHIGRTVRRPPYTGETNAPVVAHERRAPRERKKRIVREGKETRNAPRRLVPRRVPAGVCIFVIVRSIEELLRFAATYVSTIPDLGFLFVGDQPHTAVVDRPDTIVALQTGRHFEAQSDVRSFTAWWLVATHDLIDVSHVLFLEADAELQDPANIMTQLRAITHCPMSTSISLSSSAPPSSLVLQTLTSPSSSSSSLSSISPLLSTLRPADLVALGGTSVGMCTDLPLFPAVACQFGLNADVGALSILPWVEAGGRCFSRQCLAEFVSWYEPLVASIRRADPACLARYHERFAHMFAAARQLPSAFLAGLRSPGSDVRQTIGCGAPRLLRAPTETGIMRPPAIPRDFDWRFYAQQASACTGLRITTEEAAHVHWSLRGAYGGISCAANRPYTSVCRSLHLYKGGSNTFVETGSGTGDGIADALACGFERVISIECDFAHYAHCRARFSTDKRVQLAYGSSATELTTWLDRLTAPAVLWLDTQDSASLGAELQQLALQKITAHTVIVHAQNFATTLVSSSARKLGRDEVRNMLTAINRDYDFAPGPDGDNDPLVAVARVVPLSFTTSIRTGSGGTTTTTTTTAISEFRPAPDAHDTVGATPYRTLRITSAKYGLDDDTYVDVSRLLQAAVVACEWRVATPSDVRPTDLGPDPYPGVRKRLDVVYQDLDGVYRQQRLLESGGAWSPLPLPSEVSALAIVIRSARYGGVDVRSHLSAAIQAGAALHRGPVDLTEMRPSVLFGGDPAPGKPKRLDADIVYILNFETIVTQRISIGERGDAWETASPMRFPQDAAMAGAQTQLLAYDAPPHSPWLPTEMRFPSVADPKNDPKNDPASAGKCRRRRLFVVYHVALIGEWESVVTPQITALCASGLVGECERVYVSVVGKGASSWVASPSFGGGEWQRKVVVAHRSESASQYERTAIHILQTLIPDDPNVCCLYIHSKGVTQGAIDVTARGRNVALWRMFMEYYVVENYRVCVDVLLGHGYDTCGAEWYNYFWWSHPLHSFITPHYSGNFWWATGRYLAKLRHSTPGVSHVGPEMWIGLQNPRAWSLHNSPYFPPNTSLYAHGYGRERYQDAFSLPRRSDTSSGELITVGISEQKAVQRTSPSLTIHGADGRLRQTSVLSSTVPEAKSMRELSAWIATSPFSQKKKKTVVQLYQPSSPSASRKSVYGFGDYLRGVLYLHQLARTYPFQLHVDATHHPIARFLETRSWRPSSSSSTTGPGTENKTVAVAPCKTARVTLASAEIDCYSSPCAEAITKRELLDLLQNCPRNDACLLMTNVGPELPLDAESRDFIKRQCLTLLPDTSLAVALQPFMALKPYAVIHVRSGDDVLVNKGTSDWLLQNILDVVPSELPHAHVVLMSDCGDVLPILQACMELRHPRTLFHLTGARAVHLGLPTASDEGVQTTLLDFFVLAGATAIYQASPYFWGSGFSGWCSHIYNIPLHSLILPGRKRSPDASRFQTPHDRRQESDVLMRHATLYVPPSRTVAAKTEKRDGKEGTLTGSISKRSQTETRTLDMKTVEQDGMLFDVVVPVKPGDYKRMGECLDSIAHNVRGWGNIYVVSSLPETVHSAVTTIVATERLKWVSESVFPFQRVDIATYASDRTTTSGRFFQQLLKLYAPTVIPGIRPRVLVVDADLVWLLPTVFLEGEKMLLTTAAGDERHQSHDEWIRGLLPDLQLAPTSGRAHHMLFDNEVIAHLMDAVVRVDDRERKHTHVADPSVVRSKFWRIFLQTIVSQYPSGASEYELYHHYVLAIFPERVLTRVLKRKITLDRGPVARDRDRRFGFVYVGTPSHLQDHVPPRIVHLTELLSASYGDAKCADHDVPNAAAFDATIDVLRLLKEGSGFLDIRDTHNSPRRMFGGRDPAVGHPKVLRLRFIDARTRQVTRAVVHEKGLAWQDWINVYQHLSFDAYLVAGASVAPQMVLTPTIGATERESSRKKEVVSAPTVGSKMRCDREDLDAKESVKERIDVGAETILTLWTLPELEAFEGRSKHAIFAPSAVAHAFYGTESAMSDVTARLLPVLPPNPTLCCSELIANIVSNPNDLFGDPVPRTAKTLVLVVRATPDTQPGCTTFTLPELSGKLHYPMHVIQHTHLITSYADISGCKPKGARRPAEIT
jgi:hypothetical protein